MIISASYKTDIPTFYGDWFMNRLRAGYCKTVNPYNQQVIRISLSAKDVNGFVFWTKNAGPFLRHLAEIHRLGFPFLVQHTINAYPRVLEHAVVDAKQSIEHVRRISDEYGRRVCVWRYDTIIESSATPREFHLETFGRLAKALAGSVDEVVISFAHVYRKTLQNMNAAAEEHGLTWADPTDDWKRALAEELVEIAATHRIRVAVCSQPQFLVAGTSDARCVDADRLQEVAGKTFYSRLKGNRRECGCFEARDIGEYDTCPHGCVYCYAVRNRQLALDRFRRHNPESEFLFPPPDQSTEALSPREASRQLPLFGRQEAEE